MEAGATLVVMSDHGFTSWRRAFHLNTWLKERGLPGRPATPTSRTIPGLYAQRGLVAHARLRLGLNGLYINVAGRERDGIVDPGQREALAREIGAKLLQAVDPKTGERAVTKVHSGGRSTATAATSSRPRPGRGLRQGHARLERVGARAS